MSTADALPAPQGAPAGVVVVVPVKPPAFGKSRLVGLRPEQRRELAEAFALDTVAACLAAPAVEAVLVVTDDASFAARVASLGATALPDGVADDLNGTLRQAAAEAHRRWPGLRPVAVCADLPALRPAELTAALADLPARHPGFVPDAAGVGTTVYAAAYEHFDPRFGGASRRAHLEAGAVEVAAGPSVRRDVDDLGDLREALGLGVGERTAGAARGVAWA